MRKDTKITLAGDREVAKGWIGEALRQLNILDFDMRFQNLKQGARRVRIDDYTTMELSHCFGTSKAYIHSVLHVEKQEEGKWRKCFCCRCWANGYIQGYTHFDHTCDKKGCKDLQVTYDVLVCQKADEKGHMKGEYKLFQGCVPTDFAHYRISNKEKKIEGEQVLLLVGRGIPCCAEDQEEESACRVGSEDGYIWKGGDPLFFITPIVNSVLPKKYGSWEYAK